MQQLGVAAKIKGAEPPEEWAGPPVPSDTKQKRGRKPSTLKKPAAAPKKKATSWYRKNGPEEPDSSDKEKPKRKRKQQPDAPAEQESKPRKSRKAKENEQESQEEKHDAKKPQEKKKARKQMQQAEEAQTVEAAPQKTRKRTKEQVDTTHGSKAKDAKEKGANKPAQEKKVKATFARRAVPQIEPSCTFHKSVRAAFEKVVQHLVSFPSKLEDQFGK